MMDGTQSEHRFGFWAAASVSALAAMYIFVGLIGVVARPPSHDPLSQVDPYLAILEILMSLCALALLVMMAALYRCAPSNRKAHSLAALGFMVVFVTLTCSTHFAGLTLGRQLKPDLTSSLLLQQLSFEHWPTLALALDLLAWDLFLGLALLFAATVFSGDNLAIAIRISMNAAGIFCVAGVLGPALGQMRLQYLGIVGYAVFLPLTSILLAKLFRRFANF